MRAKIWDILMEDIERGIEYGWNRAHKYADTPTPEHIRECVYDAISSAIADHFFFDSETEKL